MAEILGHINELKLLPAEQHLFCPRADGEDGSVYYDEDVANLEPDDDPAAEKERKAKIAEAEERKWVALDALQILAYDGDEAAPHKEWLLTRLEGLMASCDVCVRVFHQSRSDWQNRLIEQFEESMVHDFMRIIDDNCLQRILGRLDQADKLLREAEKPRRVLRLLPNEQIYAIFEALSCAAVIKNEDLLQRHFDSPFELVQTKKRLKLQTFLPAMTRFLFSNNEARRNWAMLSWSTSKRNILKSEFEWAVRDHLVSAMFRVQMGNLDLPFVATYWGAVVLIVNKLDKELITHSLRDLEGNFYRLLLDHLSLDSEGFLDLITTMRMILEKSPADFWDAMDSITPNTITVVEQVFNSPVLKQLLLAATEDNADIMSSLHDAFSWITPFLMSIKPATLEPAVRAFANALLGRFQSDRFSKASRAYCFKEGVRVLDFAFRRMSEGTNTETFVGQPTVNKMLEILSTHIEVIVTSLKRLNGADTKEDLQLALSMIQHAFTLEAHSLEVEKRLIQQGHPSPTETPPSSPIWRAIIQAIDAENIDLATHLLIAGKNLIGLEPLSMKAGVDKIPPTVRHFNSRFTLLSQSITEVVDRLSEFSPTQLSALFEQPPAASAIISLLFSSTEATRNASIELLKVISGQDERRDALQYILKTHYKNALIGILASCGQVSKWKAFAPAPSLIRTCSDVIDVMCNSQDGILRSRELASGESGATMRFWSSLWNTLKTIFATTEGWSLLGYYDKPMMMDFCRDVMQFADQLFDQCSILAATLGKSSGDDESGDSRKEVLKELLNVPANVMGELTKWLRLRDEYLSSKSVTLIRKLLIRLHEVSIEIDPAPLQYIESVLIGKVKAKLSMQQQAELQRALETHLGHTLIKEEDEPTKQTRQASLSGWMKNEGAKDATKETSGRSKLMASLTPTANAFAEKRAALKAKEAAAAAALQSSKADDAKKAQQAEFKRRRQLELERQKKEKDAAILKAKQARGLSGATAEAGSGLEGLGILGKDQAAKGEGLMHSSDESGDDEGDFDEELFGIKKSTVKAGPKTNIINEVKVQMPVKKRRVQRSIKDMRARLAPDLSPLHKVILGWDYFHQGDFPPNSKDNYGRVQNTFRTPNEYQATFQPLLTLEAWQGFVKAREENQAKPYEIRIVSRASVDAFQEVSSTMTNNENRDIQISEGDIVLLSRSDAPSAREPHCLARVFRVQRKQAHIEVSYRVMPGNSLQSALVPQSTVWGTKIQSITPLEREYGALLGLQYYDLCDEIIRAKPSPLLTYKDSQIEPLENTYNLNRAQAKAVKSAIDNDAFTLIQGPPGSGKTKTITAIVGAVLSDSLRSRGTAIQAPGQVIGANTSKKLLVCAPSNAAVDELVMRFKSGIKTMSGEEKMVNIVRLGRSDAINANVQDVTLEALVNKRLGMNPSDDLDPEETRKLFQHHKQVSEQLRLALDQRNSGEVKGEAASKLDNEIIALRRQKGDLGTKIDKTRDQEKMQKRNADLNRRRAQEQILNDAHVICGTLSGSGHDMFQNLNIEFETVIVDEAAQCVEMSAIIPLKYGCAKCILVGDPKQLPPTVFSKEAARFQYEQSLFVRMQNNHPNDIHLLDTQYRMHPEISYFPSQTFYDGKLLDGGDMAGLRKRPWHQSVILGPYRFFDVQGQHQAAPKGHSLINIAEINIAMQLYRRVTSDHPDFDFRGKIGIITPYKSQLRELKNRFVAQYGLKITDDIDFNTTDAFQGRESEIIIFSCVRASPAGGIGFLQDIRRMNVGLTRAKSSLWVLGNTQSLVRGKFWKQLVEDAKTRDRYTDGDVGKMLSKHSNAYPAKPGMFDVPLRRVPVKQEEIKQEIKSEPMSRTGSTHSSDSEVKIRIKEEKNGNEDTEMVDIDTEDGVSEAAITRNGSGASTPMYSSDSNQKSNGPPSDPSRPGPAEHRPGDIFAGKPKPKIKRRVRESANPLLPNKRPKK